VRRQDTYLESIYNQDVKRGETREFEEYVSGCMLDNLDWLDVADNYAEFDLTIRPFEKHVLKTGGYKDFIDALYRWLGEKVEVEHLPVINPSLRADALELMRFANKNLDKSDTYDLSIWLEQHCGKKPSDKVRLFKDRSPILGKFAESNKKLFKKYMPEFNGSYYWRR